MKKAFEFLAAAAAMVMMLSGCSSARKASSGTSHDFPKVEQNGKVAIAAHRGFWKCEEAMDSQNSIASLSQAQTNAFWGSECDIHLTADKEIIVNHDNDIDGLAIAEHNYSTLRSHLLNNGEHRPSFDEYLAQTAKYPKTTLVVEFKKQPSQEVEEELIQKALKAIKAHKLYDPSKIAFISFSHYVCQRIAVLCPEFKNQYLEGDIAPAVLAKEGINGIDYKYTVLFAHPEWVKEAHDNGMSVNVWTVNKTKDMKAFIEMGVDAITTNEPLKLREILGEKEYVNQ